MVTEHLCDMAAVVARLASEWCYWLLCVFVFWTNMEAWTWSASCAILWVVLFIHHPWPNHTEGLVSTQHCSYCWGSCVRLIGKVGGSGSATRHYRCRVLMCPLLWPVYRGYSTAVYLVHLISLRCLDGYTGLVVRWRVWAWKAQTAYDVGSFLQLIACIVF